jgi:signal transduction histidine kinase
MEPDKHLNIFWIILVLFLGNSLYAQTSDQIMLDKYLAKAKASFAFPDSVLFYSSKAYELAAKTDNQRSKADAAKMMGVASHVNSRFEQAIPYYNKSLEYYKALNDTLEQGKIYLNLATTYNAKFDYEQTMKFALLSLRKFKQAKDRNGEGRAYNLLAIIYNNQQKYRAALNYFKEYADLVIAVKDSVEIGTAYNNIGATYHAFKMPDSAIYYLNESKRIHDKIGLQIRTGSVYQNLGDIYLEQGLNQKALVNYKLANNIHKQNNDLKLQAQTFLKIGEIEIKGKNYRSAEANLNEAIQLAGGIKDTEVLAKAYNSLAEAEALQGKFSEAYTHLKSSYAYSDSLNTAQNNVVVQELQTRYETERREQKIKDLNQQAAIQDLKIEQRNLFLVIAFILLLGLSFLAYTIYNQRKQKEKQLILEAELEAIRLKADAEKTLNGEKVRISKELHDNIGSYLTFIHSMVDADELKAAADPAKMDQLKALTGETIRELRKTVWLINRSDVSLDELGVKLREFFKTVPNLSLQVSGDGSKTIKAHRATELIRIIQEAVNNAVKHSKAEKIQVLITQEGEKLFVEINDRGCGFDPASGSSGFGLDNMKARAQLLKAELNISSGQQGTTISLQMPI